MSPKVCLGNFLCPSKGLTVPLAQPDNSETRKEVKPQKGEMEMLSGRERKHLATKCRGNGYTDLWD